MTRATKFNLIVIAIGGLLTTSAAQAQWPQWGGPKRDFTSEAKDLAAQWPETGPKKIWSRGLGEGYSSIVVDGGKLYTMYRKGSGIPPVAGDGPNPEAPKPDPESDNEIVVALDAATGKTLWEYKYLAPVPNGMDPQFGKGPNATPVVHDGRIYTLGVSGVLNCLDTSNGSLLWSHDLLKEYNAATPGFGFSSSPLVYKDTLIVAAGGTGTGLMAFKLSDGSVAWKKYDFGGQEKGDIYSSPILINVGGEEQMVLVSGKEVMGINPKTGDQLWGHPLANQWNTNICTPIWGDDGILYVSSGGEAGSKGLKITKDGANTKVEEVWATRKMAVGQGTCVRKDGVVYGSSGDGPAFITAINVADGKLGWRERGFGKATLVSADGKLIILDEDGNLALATPTSEALTVHSKVQLLKKPAWTAPTIVGRTLYVRDKESIMALDLGKG